MNEKNENNNNNHDDINLINNSNNIDINEDNDEKLIYGLFTLFPTRRAIDYRRMIILKNEPTNKESAVISTNNALAKKKLRKKGDGKDEKKANMTGGKVAAVTVGGVVAGALTAGIGLMAGMIVVGDHRLPIERKAEA